MKSFHFSFFHKLKFSYLRLSHVEIFPEVIVGVESVVVKLLVMVDLTENAAVLPKTFLNQVYIQQNNQILNLATDQGPRAVR